MKNKKNMGYGSFSYHWHINNKLYIFISITIESNLRIEVLENNTWQATRPRPIAIVITSLIECADFIQYNDKVDDFYLENSSSDTIQVFSFCYA